MWFQWRQTKEPSSLPIQRIWEIINSCGFRLVSVAVVCYTAINNWKTLFSNLSSATVIHINLLFNKEENPSIFLNLFILRERERERGRERERMSRIGEEREREGERESQVGFDCQHTNHEIMTWAKTKSCTLNQLSHPGAPQSLSILFFCT